VLELSKQLKGKTMPILKPPRGLLPNRNCSLARGLVGYWPMLEGTGGKISDLSNNGNIGELAGTAQWSSGLFGGCIDYDGSSGRHKIAYSPVLFCCPYMTVGFWVKSDVTNYTSSGYVVSMYDYAVNKREWALAVNASGDLWSVLTSANGINGYYTDSTLAVDSSWHYFTFVVNNSTKQWDMYIDGIYNQTITAAVTYTDRGSFLTIGGLDGSNYFDGRVDHVAIWNRRLRAAAIYGLYREPFCLFGEGINPASRYVQVFVQLAGTISAQSTLTGKLTLSHRTEELEKRWLRDALFNGMTANAFKLGTVLTSGWFWMREGGCTGLYRGCSMEQIDFDNILAVSEPNAEQISPPSFVPHQAGSIYYYVVRRFNNCGYQERTLLAATKVSIKSDGSLKESQPNKIFAVTSQQIDGSHIRLVWFYNPLEQKSPPESFKVYFDNASGQIDYENPLATIEYQGRKFYSYESSELSAGQYLFAVRAENTEGIQDESQAQIRIQLDSQNPESINILETTVL
jgi:hypothetical protein